MFTVTLVVNLADDSTSAMTVALSTDMTRPDQQTRVLAALDRLIDMHKASLGQHRNE